MYRDMYVRNLSGRELIIEGSNGTDFDNSIPVNAGIPSDSPNFRIGHIGEPRSGETNHWGWIYLKTKTDDQPARWTKLVLYMFVHNSHLKDDNCYAGFRQGADVQIGGNPALCESMIASARQTINENENHRKGGDFQFTIYRF